MTSNMIVAVKPATRLNKQNFICLCHLLLRIKSPRSTTIHSQSKRSTQLLMITLPAVSRLRNTPKDSGTTGWVATFSHIQHKAYPPLGLLHKCARSMGSFSDSVAPMPLREQARKSASSAESVG